MKILIALCLVACSLVLFAQSNTSPLSPEQKAVISAAAKVQFEEMQRQMEVANALAQERALERAARLATNPQPRFDTNPVVIVAPKPYRYFDTNDHSPGIGDKIRDFDRIAPGFATNFLPSQLALTNPHRKVIYLTNGVAPVLPSSSRQP